MSVLQLGILLGVNTLTILLLRNILAKFIFTPIGGCYVPKNDKKSLNLRKFTESAWRLFYYTSVSVYGLVVLWDKSWLWNVTECWNNFDNQVVTFGVWSHFIISFSYSLLALIRLDSHMERRYFHMMLVHHVLHSFLLFTAWNLNMFRASSLFQVAHDWCGVFTEASKTAKYMGYQKNTLFNVLSTFFVVWVSVRLVLVPYWEIKILMEVPIFAPNLLSCATYHLACASFLILNILNVVWIYFIMKVLLKCVAGHHDAVEVLSEEES